MTQFETVIGLEVHAQMVCKSKIFCSCSTSFGKAPNENTCPICLGLPGTLPVLNQQAVDYAIKAGLALNCEIQKRSIWDRKNYFYPDLPKGYQITQFAQPICLGGHVNIVTEELGPKKIHLTRIHMEEDAGKLVHDYGDERSSHVDLNRAGTPLMEIVSEPEMRSAQEASSYLKALRSILRYCQVCDGNMQEGSLRCDANVSIRPVGDEKLGTKVEIKNINSFKFIEKAIEYEVKRQKACYQTGEEIIQETRLWDTNQNMTQSMRSKEDAHDYRYFPDPDLVPLIIDQQWIDRIKKTVPELPEDRCKRFVKDFGLSEYDSNVLTVEKSLADFFEQASKYCTDPKKLASFVMTELLRELNNADLEIEESKVSSENMGRLINLIDDGTISGKIAKKVFLEMFETGQAPDKIVQEKGLVQVSDMGAIEKVIDEIMAANASQVEQYRSGKEKVFGFFVGQVMKIMKGQANPKIVNDLLKKKLSS